MDWKALTEVRTEEAKKIRREYQKTGRDFSPRRGKVLVPRKDNMSNTVTAGRSKEHLLVSGQTNGTNMQAKYTKNTLESATQRTSEQLNLVKFQTSTYLWEDFLARLLASLESGEDSMILEELSFLKSLGFSPTKDPDIFYSKTSKVYLVMTVAKLSRRYLGFSPTWGMSINGRFLTAKISESHRIGKECSLSDILEEHPDQKYFLSEAQKEFILNPMRLKKKYTLVHSQQDNSQAGTETTFDQTKRIHSTKGISPTVPTASGGWHIPMVRVSDD